MVALWVFVFGFNGDVDFELASIVVSVQAFKVDRLNEINHDGDSSVHCHLNQWNGSRLNKLNIFDPFMLLKISLKPLESKLISLILRRINEIIQDGIVNGNVNIAIFYGDSAWAAAEQLNGYFIHLQQKSNPFKCYHSSIMEIVGLFRNVVRKVYQLFVYLL